MGRREQAIDKAFVGVGTLVVEKRLDLGEGRREAGEVEGKSTDQRGRSASVGSGLPFETSSQNASTGVRTRSACRTVGVAVGWTGRNAQWSFPSAAVPTGAVRDRLSAYLCG